MREKAPAICVSSHNLTDVTLAQWTCKSSGGDNLCGFDTMRRLMHVQETAKFERRAINEAVAEEDRAFRCPLHPGVCASVVKDVRPPLCACFGGSWQVTRMARRLPPRRPLRRRGGEVVARLAHSSGFIPPFCDFVGDLGHLLSRFLEAVGDMYIRAHRGR